MTARADRNNNSFFCFFQFPYPGGVFGTDIGVNKLQDLAIVPDRRRSITLFLVGCPAPYVLKGVFRILGYLGGEHRDSCVEVALVKRSESLFVS